MIRLHPVALAIAAAAAVSIAAVVPAVAQSPSPLPVGAEDAYEAPHAGGLTVGAAEGLLANDTGMGLVAELWTEPSHGAVEVAPDGGFAYVRSEPAPSDTFSYLVSDASGASSGPITVVIRFANGPVTCTTARAPDSPQGEPVEFDLADACTDPDGDAITFTYQRPDVPAGSIWEADAAGHVLFVPPVGWSGTGTVLFTATDGTTRTIPTIFQVRVLPVDESPPAP
jgi:hypothetical protein